MCEIGVVKKNYDLIDIMKAILAIMVVAIHALPESKCYTYIFPWVRIAVPLFFITSGYFLFRKMKNSTPDENRKTLKRFLIRNLKLYLLWLLVLLPVTIKYHNYPACFDYGFLRAAVNIAIDFFFGNTFLASWYIMALMIGTIIVYALSDRMGKRIFLVLAAVIYIVCCLVSNYGKIFNDITPFRQIMRIYPTKMWNSFPVSILWIYIGKLFAERKEGERINHSVIKCIIFALLLFVEWLITKRLDSFVKNDCYFMLVPLCVVLFDIILNADIRFKYAVYLRNYSTVTYCLHFSLIFAAKELLSKMGIKYTATGLFFGAIIASVIATFVILKLKNIKGFRWMKYMI